MSVLRRLLQRTLGISPLVRDDLTPPPPSQYTRADMDVALKSIVVPHLRQLGFKGSLPHFHRLRADAADLLTVQFSTFGGKFVVELGRVPATGLDFHGREVPLSKANTSYLRERHRLGSELRANYGDHWFAFADRNPQDVAQEVCVLLDDPALWQLIDTFQLPDKS